MTTAPTYYAYTVKNRGKARKAIWTKIGAAWLHSTERGFSIELDALPVDGRIVLIEPRPADTVPASDGAAPASGEGTDA